MNKSNNSNPADTMKCHDCGQDHADWTKRSEGPAAPDSPATLVVWECEKCGGTEEVPHL